MRNTLHDRLDEIENHRTEAIYNRSYRYIKEIIYDTELEEQFGTTREGYEQFKNTSTYGYSQGEVNISHSGVTSLRTLSVRKTGGVLGFIAETKNQLNEPLLEIQSIYINAKQDLFTLLGATDTTALEYWLDNEIHIDPRQANTYKHAIHRLIEIYEDYTNYSDFKQFIDKLIN